MNRIQATGAIYVVSSVLGIIFYALLLARFPIAVLKITAFIAVAGFLGVLGWVGLVMFKAPQAKSKDE